MTLTAGIDVGTSSVKVALVETHTGGTGRLVTTVLERIRRRDVAAVAADAYDAALRECGASRGDVAYAATTGEGDLLEWRSGHFYGMTTHARGALFLLPATRGAMDVGALHTRAMRFDERGRVLSYRMSSQCASGTGQFLENIARYLGVSIEEVGPLSLRGDKPERPSGICAVLAETDVINMVSRGISTSNILRGIHESMATRLVSLIRAAKIQDAILITGGLSRDAGLVDAIRLLAADGGAKLEVLTHDLAQHAGAIGAALWGAYRHERLYSEVTAPSLEVQPAA